MNERQHKIEIASDEDVAKYGGAPAPQSASSPVEESASQGPSGETPADLEALQAEVAQWKDKFLRAKADFQNYQRRSQQDRAEALKFANAEFARSLLPVLDDFERAMEHAGGATNDGDPVVHALRLIYDNLVKTLRQHHIEPIEATGQPFDPARHEAMMQQESDQHAEPTVLQVLQKGYKLHDRVLRPAKVVVSKPPPTTQDEPPAMGDVEPPAASDVESPSTEG